MSKQCSDEGWRNGLCSGETQKAEGSRGGTMKCICVLEGYTVDIWVITLETRSCTLTMFGTQWNLSSVLRILYFEGNGHLLLFLNRFVFERFHSYPAGKDEAILRIDTERSGRGLRTAYKGHFRQDRDYELRFGCVCSSIWQRTEWKWYVIGGRVLSLWKLYRKWSVRWHLMDERKTELVKET